MHSTEKLFAIAAFALGSLVSLSGTAADNCGQMVSTQGAVEIQRSGQSAWAPARIDAQVCEGDRLRVGPLGRAALFVGPSALIRVEQNSTLGLRLTPEATEIELQSGAVYSISRFPRRYRIITPFVNAGVEGTEFLVALDRDQAQVAVYEGRVSIEDLIGERGARRSLRSGEMARIARGVPPAVTVLVNPADAVQWALYYPPLDPQSLGESIFDLPDCERLAAGERPRCLTRRAGKLLRLGRVERAERDLQEAPSDDAYALALRALIRVVKNDKSAALELARRAASRDDRSVPALLALSYAEQAHFRLDEALAAASRAAALEPANAVAQARRAELLLSVGRIEDAEAAASAAVQASPADSRARTVLGFAQLARLDTRRAREQLSRAAALDASDPLPRLGLGLATIKDGRLAEGRSELELAVALDPQNALLRSYLGKAYSDELRDALAEGQLERAKALDPRDPTPWYYNAIRLQALNRPGEALEELHESIVRNENRAVYRSRLLLEQDRAARSASLARIYSDLGLDQLAVVEAMHALDADPTAFPAHRFLADAYQRFPRFEIARLSELLQSQLRQPASALPMPVSRLQPRAPILQTVGPAYPSFQEFGALFERDRHLLYGSGLLGTDDTASGEVLYAGLRGSYALQLGGYGYRTDGFRPNNDLRHEVYGAMFQKDFAPATSIQLEARRSDQENGDVRLQFDPQRFSGTLRESEDIDSLRLGLRHATAPGSEWLFSVIGQKRAAQRLETAIPLFGPIVADLSSARDGEGLSAELQHARNIGAATIVVGAGHFGEDTRLATTTRAYDATTGAPFGPTQSTAVEPEAEHNNAYLYVIGRPARTLSVTLGASYDDLDTGAGFKKSNWAPKLGLGWRPADNLLLRAAGFETLKRPFAANQTLEPTHVSGLNQFFDDATGTKAQGVGAAADARLGRSVFAGVMLTRRKLDDVPFLNAATAQPSRFLDFDESRHRGYVAWLPAARWALSLEYHYDSESREIPAGFTDNLPREVKTQLAPVSLAYHDPDSWFVKLVATAFHQKVDFLTGSPAAQRESTWLADALVGYRLPRRLGTVTLEAKNLLDTNFNIFDTDMLGAPKVPFLLPVRSVLLQVRLVL